MATTYMQGGNFECKESITYMQFLAARSLCTNLCSVRYSIPLAIWRHMSIILFWVLQTCVYALITAGMCWLYQELISSLGSWQLISCKSYLQCIKLSNMTVNHGHTVSRPYYIQVLLEDNQHGICLVVKHRSKEVGFCCSVHIANVH